MNKSYETNRLTQMSVLYLLTTNAFSFTHFRGRPYLYSEAFGIACSLCDQLTGLRLHFLFSFLAPLLSSRDAAHVTDAHLRATIETLS